MFTLKLAVWIYILTSIGIVNGQVTLTPGTVLVYENNPVTLTCTYTGTGTVSLVAWFEVVGDVGGTDDINKGSIFPSVCTDAAVDDTKYTYSCPNNKQVTWTIKNVDRTNNGNRWACSVTAPSFIYSNGISIDVQVPITSVSMILPTSDATLDVPENTEQRFRCRTDGGLPVADITWYKDNGTPDDTSDDIKIEKIITPTQTTDNGLYIRTSLLKYYPSRSDTGNRIYCTAKNSDSQTPLISSLKPLLNVLYGPDGPPTIDGGGTYQVTENLNATLTCTSTGGNPVPTLSWTCYEGQTSSTGTTSTTVVLIRTWTAVRDTNRECTCTSTHSVTGQQTVKVNVQVLYPPSTPAFTLNSNPVSGTVKVIQGKTLRIQCVSSGQPIPTYTWTYRDNTIQNGQELVLDNIQTSSDGQYTCKVENYPDLPSGTTPARASSQVTVQVLFAPTTPTIYYNTISDSPISVNPFDVVAGDSLPVACRAEGQPEPNYIWKFNNNQHTGQRVVLSSIDRDIVDTTVTCIATNQLEETGSTSKQRSSTATVVMNIMYPPDNPTIKLKYGSGTYTSISDIFSVLEGVAFVLDCQGSSKPDPSYQWFGSGSQSSTEFNVPADTTTKDGVYVYMCEVTNQMTRAYGLPTTQEGKNSTNVTANVLYGPVVLPMSNQSAEEGKLFRYNCPYTSGNPAETTVKWTSDDGNNVWNSEMLDIVNVSKNDKMKYTCTVKNTMNPTNQNPVTDLKSGYFYLDVKYKASIEQFTVQDQTNKEDTVDEFTSPSLVCSVDSNPASNIQVLFRGQTLAKDPSTLQLTHQLSNVSCGDIGVYTCIGRNNLNTQTPPRRDVVLLVNCRPQPYGDIDYTLYSAQRVTATLRMSVLAFPVSPSVVWRTGETELENNAKLTMTVNQVESTESYIHIIQLDLTIHNVTIAYFGEYKVQISNGVGMMEKTFFLQAEDIPESPTEFELVTGTTKTTEATIQWKPQFNGGPNQTFVLLYKKESDMEWNIIYINETGEEMMKYKLDNLESNTAYIVKIYAQNRVGNSSTSKDVSIRTLEIADASGGNTGMIVGGVIGGIVFAGLVAFAVVFLLRRYRVWNSNKHESNNGDHTKANTPTEDVSYYNIGRSEEQRNNQSTNEVTYYNEGRVPEYEMINQQNRDVNTYSSLQLDRNSPTNDISREEDKTYENLKLSVI